MPRSKKLPSGCQVVNRRQRYGGCLTDDRHVCGGTGNGSLHLAESKQHKLIVELRSALANVKPLSGLIPICAWRKNVRNDQGFWSSVEQFVRSHTDVTFSHGMCPDCRKKFAADIDKVAHAQPGYFTGN